MASLNAYKARAIGSVPDAAGALADVARAKTEAAKTPPGADLSDRNLARANREGWNRTGSPKATS